MRSKTASVDAIRATRLITAIKTPYLPNGKVDLASFDGLVERQIEGGVGGIVVGGTTGEGQLMSWDEHIMLIAHTAKLYGDELKIVGNTGSNSTREAVHATSQGFAVGEKKHACPAFKKPCTEMGPPYHSTLCDRHGCIAANQSLLRQNLIGWNSSTFSGSDGLRSSDRVQCACTYLARYFAGYHAAACQAWKLRRR